MSADFFYNTYAKFSRRGSNIRLRMTPFGIIVISVCILSGLAGLNIFVSGLYRISSLSISVLIIAYFSKIKNFNNISVRVFFNKQYHVDETSKYSLTFFNESSMELFDLELIPVIRNIIPAKEDFMSKKEPFESGRNIWDRNIYYFRWLWHILRLHKVELRSIKIKNIKPRSHVTIEGNILPVKRGKIDFDGFNVIKKDLFGIFSSYQFFSAKESIVILPKKVQLESGLKKQIFLNTERRNRLFSNQFHKYKTGDFVGLREYIPGDPVKNIHWKSWAKTGKATVVEKGIEKNKEYTIFLINITSQETPDFNILFEDCMSYLYSTVKYFEENEYELSFNYFSRDGEPLEFTAEKERGSYPKLYNLFSEIDYYNIGNDKTLSNLNLKINRTMNSMIFGVIPSEEIIALSSRLGSTSVFCDGGTENKGRVKIPRINKSVDQVNIV